MYTKIAIETLYMGLLAESMWVTQSQMLLQEVPRVGLGTGYTDCYGSQINCDVPPVEFFEEALEAGCRLFDTAYLYGTEKNLGEALRRWVGRGNRREEVYIIAKPPSTKYLCGACGRLRREGARMEGCTGECVADVLNISQAIDKSLSRLGVSYVDAVLMHTPGEESQKSFIEQWSQLEFAATSGKTRALGLTSQELPWSKTSAPAGISRQGKFWKSWAPTLVFHDGNRRELPYRKTLKTFWQELGIRVFGGGLNRLTLEDDPEDSDANLSAVADILQERRARGEVLNERQILLMFMSQSGLSGPGSVLPQTRSLVHLKENLGVLQLAPLTELEIERISDGIHRVEREEEFLLDEDSAVFEIDTSSVEL